MTGLASRCWENMILAMLGEQFMVGEEICGAVVSVRHQVRDMLVCGSHKKAVKVQRKKSWNSSLPYAHLIRSRRNFLLELKRQSQFSTDRKENGM